MINNLASKNYEVINLTSLKKIRNVKPVEQENEYCTGIAPAGIYSPKASSLYYDSDSGKMKVKTHHLFHAISG